MVSTLEEWGYYGLFKYVGRCSRVLGLFLFIMTPEPKVSTWQKYYGLFIVIPWINGLFLYSLYREFMNVKDSSAYIWTILYIIHTTSTLLYINFAVWTAPTRIYSWLLCLRNIEKILVRTKETKENELFRCKVLTVYILTILFVTFANSIALCNLLNNCTFILFFDTFTIFFLYGMCTICDSLLFIILIVRVHTATKIMNEELNKLLHEGAVDKRPILLNNYMIGSNFKARKCSDGAEKVRELSKAYMTISEVIKTVMETGEVGMFLYIMGNLVRLLTRVYKYARWQYLMQAVSFDGHIILISIFEIFWCTHTIVKTFIFCEGPHQIHSKLQETQDLIAKLKKKYHEDTISNELHLFLRLTMLSRPTFSPLNVCTLNRGLVAKILGCTATYLIAFMQLEVNEK